MDDGFTAAVIMILVIMTAYYVGKVVDQKEVASDCMSFNKTHILGNGMFDCKEILK